MYVGDCLFFGRDPNDIDEIIQDLQEPEDKDKEKFFLNKEDNVAVF